MSENKAQSSIEQLIIIATLFSIAAMVIYMVYGTIPSVDKNVRLNNCRDAAMQCDLFIKGGNSTGCALCYDKCAKNGADILTGTASSPSRGALKCCLAGNYSKIFDKSAYCV